MKLPGGRKAIIAIIPVALLIGGFAGYTQIAHASAPAVPDPGVGQHGAMLALDSRVINLAPGGAYRYAKVAVTVELRPDSASFYAMTGDARANAETAITSEYTDDVPLLLDALGQVVSAKTSDDLVSAAGRDALKSQLLAAMRQAIGQKPVIDVYLTDFVMQ